MVTTAAREARAQVVRNLCTGSVSAIDGVRVAPPLRSPRRPGPRFTLVLPSGFAPHNVGGSDSDVGAWADSAGRVIDYDYGAGMDLEWLRARFVDYVECHDSIGGLPVLLTAGYDTAGRSYSLRGIPQYVATAHWRGGGLGPHMTVSVTSQDSAGFRRGLAVLRSVRFHWPSWAQCNQVGTPRSSEEFWLGRVCEAKRYPVVLTVIGASTEQTVALTQFGNSHESELRRCYRDVGLKQDSLLTGDLRLAVSVGAEGKVDSVRTVERSWNGAPAVAAAAERCIRATVLMWKWQAGSPGTYSLRGQFTTLVDTRDEQ